MIKKPNFSQSICHVRSVILYIISLFFSGVLGFCRSIVSVLVSRHFGQVLYQSHYFGSVTRLELSALPV